MPGRDEAVGREDASRMIDEKDVMKCWRGEGWDVC